MSWTAPREYVPGEVLTAAKLQEISDDLQHLYRPPALTLTVRGAGVNVTSTSTTFVPVDVAQFYGVLVTSGADLALEFDASVTNSVANLSVIFDVLIDGSVYASSLTATAVTNGLWAFRGYTAANIFNGSGRHILPAGSLSAGSHNFSLVWKVPSASTNTLYLNGYTAQFRVRE